MTTAAQLTPSQLQALSEAAKGPLFRGVAHWRRTQGGPWISCQTIASLVRRGLLSRGPGHAQLTDAGRRMAAATAEGRQQP